MISLNLIHRCDVDRYTASAQGYGKQRTPEPHLIDVFCRFKHDTQDGFNSLTGHFAVADRYSLQVGFHEDIAPGDRVSNVVDEYGEPIAGNFEVKSVLPKRGKYNHVKVVELHKVS